MWSNQAWYPQEHYNWGEDAWSKGTQYTCESIRDERKCKETWTSDLIQDA